MVKVPSLNMRCLLGESPIWHPEEGCLYLVDLNAGKLISWYPDTGKTFSKNIGRITTALTRQIDGSLLLFHDRGAISRLGPDGTIQYLLVEMPQETETRFNDVIADPAGRVFAGTEPTKDRPGRLYRIEPDLSFEVVLEGIGEPNGLGFSLDRRTLYLVDSLSQIVWRFDYNQSNGVLSDQRTFTKFYGDEFPDGLTVDSNDNVWIAIWSGSRIARFTADASVLKSLYLPTKFVTSLAFGGTDLSTLFVTSAVVTTPDNDEKADYADAGKVFMIRPGVAGLLEFPSRLRFKG